MFQVEEKTRKVLQEITDGNRDLSLTDKPKTPYFNAVIMVRKTDFLFMKFEGSGNAKTSLNFEHEPFPPSN